jgi:hypothetical protein
MTQKIFVVGSAVTLLKKSYRDNQIVRPNNPHIKTSTATVGQFHLHPMYNKRRVKYDFQPAGKSKEAYTPQTVTAQSIAAAFPSRPNGKNSKYRIFSTEDAAKQYVANIRFLRTHEHTKKTTQGDVTSDLAIFSVEATLEKGSIEKYHLETQGAWDTTETFNHYKKDATKERIIRFSEARVVGGALQHEQVKTITLGNITKYSYDEVVIFPRFHGHQIFNFHPAHSTSYGVL